MEDKSSEISSEVFKPGRLVVERFKLTPRREEIARAIRDTVEKWRPGLIEAHPGRPGRIGGLLAPFILGEPIYEPSRFESASWDEILLSEFQVLEDAALLARARTSDVVECIQYLGPSNWTAVVWANMFERTFTELWDLKLSLMGDKTPAERAKIKETEQKKAVSLHYKTLAAQRHAKATPSETETEVISCLMTSGAKYKNQEAFVRDMLEKFEVSDKTIRRWLKKAPEEAFPSNWNRRKPKP